MANFNVLSLADIFEKADRSALMRQQSQMEALKLAEMGQQIQSDRALSDLLSNSVQTVGGSPAVAAQPEQVMPEGVLGPPRPAAPEQPAIPGRSELSWDKAFSQIPDIDPSIRGKAVLELQKMRMADELKRMEIAAKMQGGGTNRAVTDNELAIVASGGISGNPNADRLGRDGAVSALQRKPFVIPEGGLLSNKGFPGTGGFPNTRVLDKASLDELRDVSTTYDRIKDISSTFRDEFAGKGLGIFADASTWLASRRDDNSPMANWARKYEALNMVERHKNFGSALTKTEVDSWNKTMASLAQGSGNMRQHLANLENLAKKVLAYTAKPRMIDKYNQDQVRAAIGDSAYDELSANGRVSHSGQMKTWEDGEYFYRTLPDGTTQRKKK